MTGASPGPTVAGTGARIVSSWARLYAGFIPICQILIAATLLALLPASRSGAADIIRCPDWQRYAPPVVLATVRDGQTEDSFTSRTGAGDSGQPRATGGSSPPAVCTHTVMAGDMFGKLAVRYLGTSRRWNEIARANPGVDPKRLRIGQILKLPCAAPAPDAATATNASPTAGTGFLARLFGRAASAPADAAEQSAALSATVAAPAAATPETPPMPTWTAKQGEYLADVLRRWGKTAGYTVIIDTTDAWRLGVAIRLRAGFETAVDELVSGLAHDGTPPRVRLYPNAVLRLGGPL